MSGMRSPETEAGEGRPGNQMQEKPCPACGEPVKSTAKHIRSGQCEGVADA